MSGYTCKSCLIHVPDTRMVHDCYQALMAEVERLGRIVDAQAHDLKDRNATLERSTRAIELLQHHARLSWNRGNLMGQAAASTEAKGAVNRLKVEIEGRATDNAAFTEEIMGLEGLLKDIGDFAHDRSTGPAVPDALWEIRGMAYDGFIGAKA